MTFSPGAIPASRRRCANDCRGSRHLSIRIAARPVAVVKNQKRSTGDPQNRGRKSSSVSRGRPILPEPQLQRPFGGGVDQLQVFQLLLFQIEDEQPRHRLVVSFSTRIFCFSTSYIGSVFAGSSSLIHLADVVVLPPAPFPPNPPFDGMDVPIPGTPLHTGAFFCVPTVPFWTAVSVMSVRPAISLAAIGWVRSPSLSVRSRKSSCWIGQLPGLRRDRNLENRVVAVQIRTDQPFDRVPIHVTLPR